MYYLGISGGITGDFTHDPAACLIKDNKIIAIAEEERFVRIKHAHGIFPINAINFCLKQAGIKLKDVDKIGYYINPNLFFKKIFHPKSLPHWIKCFRMVKYVPKIFKFNFGYLPKINYIEHHLCHVYSSFPLSGFKKGKCFSIDGVGERTSTLISSFGNGFEKIKEAYDPNSLGRFYGHFTEWLGFKMNNGEGKVMGLASYGKSKYDLTKFIRFKDGIHEVKGNTNLMSSGHLYNLIVSKFGDRRIGDIKKIHKDVAASVQDKLEEIILKMVEYHQTKNLCLSGGVALNCKMNGKILNSGLIKDIFIQPVASDAGCSIGAAVFMAMKYGNNFKKMEHVYFGPEYSNEEIEKTLKKCKINYEYHDDISGVCAELLEKQNIIGWFQGRMECGPRALGNRSILADPRDVKMKDKINILVKHREQWRPFCPSILDEDKDEYLVNAYESPFMILTFEVLEDKVKDIPAVIHVDNTCRPQTVKKDVNPIYYDLIKEFKKLTGIPLILNTSFNIRGQPIICKPEEALAMFFSEGMDALAMGNFLIKKD